MIKINDDKHRTGWHWHSVEITLEPFKWSFSINFVQYEIRIQNRCLYFWIEKALDINGNFMFISKINNYGNVRDNMQYV